VELYTLFYSIVLGEIGNINNGDIKSCRVDLVTLKAGFETANFQKDTSKGLKEKKPQRHHSTRTNLFWNYSKRSKEGKSYVCICGKTFSEKRHLKKHNWIKEEMARIAALSRNCTYVALAMTGTDIEDSEIRFDDNPCSHRNFRRMKKLEICNNMWQYKHKVAMKKARKLKLFKCRCGKSFLHRSHLKKHIEVLIGRAGQAVDGGIHGRVKKAKNGQAANRGAKDQKKRRFRTKK
jgi:hypothetical protein